MKTFAVMAGCLAFFVGSAACGQDKAKHAGGMEHAIVLPDTIKWGPPPPGLPPGSEAHVLAGDPSKAGMPFTIRAKMPDGYTVPPHWHSVDESVTVLQGALLMGKGDKLDKSKAEKMPTGAFVHMQKTT